MEHIIHATDLLYTLQIPYIALHITGIHVWRTFYWLCTTSTCMCVCTAACGMGSMRRQQLHLDHDEIMGLNIFTNIANEQFLFRMCMQTNIDEIIVQ